MGYYIGLDATLEEHAKWTKIEEGIIIGLGLSHLFHNESYGTYDEMDRLGIDYEYVDRNFVGQNYRIRRIKLEQVKKKTLPAVLKLLNDIEKNKDKMKPEAYHDARGSLLTISYICKSAIRFKRDVIVDTC